MNIRHIIATPETLETFRFAKPAEVKEYFDLLLKLGEKIATENCTKYWQRSTDDEETSRLRPFWRAQKMAKGLLSCLDFAGVELSESDRARAELIVAKKQEIPITEFATKFENQYFREAERIYAMHWMNWNIFGYNYRMWKWMTVAEAMNREVQADLKKRALGIARGDKVKAPVQSLTADAFDLSALAQHSLETAPRKGLSGLVWDMDQCIRVDIKSECGGSYEDCYVDPLTNQLHAMYGDEGVKVYPMMLLGGHARIEAVLRENAKLYRQMGMLRRFRYVSLRPKEYEYEYLQRAKAGEVAWWQTTLGGYDRETLDRALQLFGLIERDVEFKIVLPSGSCVGLPVGPQLAIFGQGGNEVTKNYDESWRDADEATQRRYWQAAHRVELHADGSFVIHSEEESQGTPAWYKDLIMRGLKELGQGHHSFEEYEVANPKPWSSQVFGPFFFSDDEPYGGMEKYVTVA